MLVKNLIKTSSGLVEFEGELSEQEFTFIFQTGLGTLLEHGAMAVAGEDEEFDD